MKLIKKHKKNLCSLLAALLLISTLNNSSPLAETFENNTINAQTENTSEPNLTGGIITSISNSRFLSNMPAQTLYVGDSIDMLSGTISAIEEQKMTIEKDDTSYTQPITVDWNEEVFDTSVTGSFDLVATIVTPEGVTFAPGVLTHITVPVTVIEKPEMIEITSLTDYGTITSTVLIPVSDAAIWEQTVQNWYDYYSYVWGVSDNDEGADVVLENLDISQVDYTTPGDYTVVLSYQIADYLQDYYTLAEDLQTVYIPVKVSDPSEFELVINHFDAIKFTGSYIYEPEENLEFLYIVTDEAVDTEILDTISGEAVSETMGFASGHIFRIFVDALEENMHYYFFGKDGNTYSNYVHIYNDDTLPTYDYMEGDRDGGDSSNSQLPEYNPELNPVLPVQSEEPVKSPTPIKPIATPTPIPLSSPKPSQTVATPTPNPIITPKPSQTVAIPTQKPHSSAKPSGVITVPTPIPLNTTIPPKTTIKPHITVNPILLVTNPQDTSNETDTEYLSKNVIVPVQSQAYMNPETSVQPKSSIAPEVSTQPKTSVTTDASTELNNSATTDASTEPKTSVTADTSAKPMNATSSSDTDSNTSDKAVSEKETTPWMTLLIVIAILVVLIIIIELIIIVKRRRNNK